MIGRILAGLLCVLTFIPAAFGQGPTTRNVTFLSTSDSHYVESTRKNNRNESNRNSIDEMNRITDAKWPQALGGDAVQAPRGVVVLGDCIDDGDKVINGKNVSAEQYKDFIADFGLDGTDGRLKYPVYEGFGNHDGPPEGKEKNGFSFRGHLKERNKIRLSKHLISNLSENGLHYSWDWDDIHFVQLNIYPANRQHEGVHYSPEWHNPQDALDFLKKDLAEKVGASGRPVVLMSHCGFDTDWWVPDDWRAAYEVAKPYNVILYIYGHTGTGVRTWAPSGETKKWQCINDGQTEKGFFVIQIVGDRLRFAMREKSNYVVTKDKKEDSVMSKSDGTWGWKWMLDRKIDTPPK